MKGLKRSVVVLGIATLTMLMGCGEDGVLLFSVQDDIALGEQVANQIASDTSFVILSETEYSEAYAYLNSMANSILNSDEIKYRDEFAWKMHIVHDDEVLNAFATPGGYIYVYTGLIKFLDKEDDLAGVMGHEIAHSDRRHGSRQMQKQYGIGILLSVLTGTSESTLVEIVGNIAGTAAVLAFSRSDEADADEHSVIYLSETKYACNGAFTFFQKLIDAGQTGRVPEFLSTHPDPASRVAAINEKAEKIGCSTDPVTPPTYNDLKASLPE